MADEHENGLDIGRVSPRELARVTLILTEAGVTFDQASTGDLPTLLYVCETGAQGIKQMAFRQYQERQQVMGKNGIVAATADVLDQIKRSGRGN